MSKRLALLTQLEQLRNSGAPIGECHIQDQPTVKQELCPTDYYGVVVWLGRTPQRQDILKGVEEAELLLGFEGIAGDVHEGPTRPSCSRVTQLYPLNTEIRNTRQLTILSAENLAEIARDMGLERLAPELVGANIVVENIPDLTHLTPSSRLQSDSGTTIVVDRLNQPCTYPARSIERAHPGFGKLFRRAGEGRRGVTAWVERPGGIKIGDRLRLHVPRQRAWQPEPSTGA